MVVDFGFGLSQLSGDESLLIMLLAKIKTEYSNCDNKLKEMFDNEQWEDAKTLIHTLKGVAGNLGCKQLYATSKQMEDELKLTLSCPNSFPIFVNVLNDTTALIQQAEKAGTVEIAFEKKLISDVTELVCILKQNIYISHDEIAKLLATIQYNDEKKQQLTLAIDTLNYALALELLNS
ncbi:Hpt domain-containing protein [Alteromonas sp. 5E99-2]|uniref:Hpt domain-containing protein n=1 Tax=Alteromonas sp. 5E99-2 TaxID=2817683 RepID=UPI001A99C255|nr:Hpt domain-containing protein [Alteromonas sp. 5E99-2]MBO1255991.1 Hpt domain-containing protein [Alteromonas sp. 5E99-2]